jgi:two-component system cell cycle response regulator DivK
MDAGGVVVAKILYVEDNDDNVYMLKNRLSRAGFTVVVATDGTRGIAMASSEQLDLILMDLTLPDINGEEATRRLKADPATKRIPVIALTANAMAGDREKAIAAGCDDFDTKPVDMSRLLEKIEALKSSRQARGGRGCSQLPRPPTCRITGTTRQRSSADITCCCRCSKYCSGWTATWTRCSSPRRRSRNLGVGTCLSEYKTSAGAGTARQVNPGGLRLANRL